MGEDKCEKHENYANILREKLKRLKEKNREKFEYVVQKSREIKWTSEKGSYLETTGKYNHIKI